MKMTDTYIGKEKKMAMAGSFKRCLEQMIEMVGREPSLKMVIIKDDTAEDYKLMRRVDWMIAAARGPEREYRLVLGATYYELKELLKPRQMDIFSEVNNGAETTDI